MQLRERHAEGLLGGAGGLRVRDEGRLRLVDQRPRVAAARVQRQRRRPARPGRRGGVAGRVARPQQPQGGGRRVRTQVGLGVRERALDGAEHEVVDLAAVTEAHFELGRVRVDVDELRIERQIQHVGGMAAVVQHVAVGEAHRVHEQPVAHRAAVDEPELLVRLRARARRQADPSREHHAARPTRAAAARRRQTRATRPSRCARARPQPRRSPGHRAARAPRDAVGSSRRSATARAARSGARCGRARWHRCARTCAAPAR